MFIRQLLLSLFFTCSAFYGRAQDELTTLKNYQFSSTRVSQAFTKYNDSLRVLFQKKGLTYPNNNILLRAFKSSNELELWARDADTGAYTLVKNYKVCALSGALGPKRWEGDLQVPEGYYFIDDFNPRSDFYLSLLVSYPNYSDLVMGNKEKPGGNIYIHGGCVTVGCLPMTDPVIQEIYVAALSARMAGENYIPVHIYPLRFDRRGLNFLGREYREDTAKQRFWVNLKTGYDYFEIHHKTLPVMYSADGRYVY